MTEKQTTSRRVAVWDIPVRIFHWLLVTLVIAAWITAETGGNAMDWHMYIGYSILVLVLFRIVWGFVGSRYARFRSFIYGPVKTARYAASLLKTSRASKEHYYGHNPMGGWSVILLLLALLIQASTGLFADDDIFTQGPLAHWVSGDTRSFLTGIHHQNFNILLILIGTHLSAILFYWLAKKENLLFPMFSGYKPAKNDDDVSFTFVSLWRAGLVLMLVAGVVYALVTLA